MRSWIFDKLSTPVISDDVPGGIHQVSSLEATPDEKPFIIYTVGTKTPSLDDGNITVAQEASVTIYVHGIPGDYDPIDELMKSIRGVFESAHDDSVILARFLTESDDLRDPEMGTIMRFIRFQLIHKP